MIDKRLIRLVRPANWQENPHRWLFTVGKDGAIANGTKYLTFYCTGSLKFMLTLNTYNLTSYSLLNCGYTKIT